VLCCTSIFSAWENSKRKSAGRLTFAVREKLGGRGGAKIPFGKLYFKSKNREGEKCKRVRSY